MRRERDILERAVRAVAEQAAAAAAIVDEALAAGLDGSHPVTVSTKMLRQELLSVKADLERELGQARPRLHGVRADGSLGRRARRDARTLGHTGSRRSTASR